jgi:hypothetical protein
MRSLLPAVLLIAAAAAAAIVVNVALLGYASTSHEPVGKLNLRAGLPAAPQHVIRPQTGPAEDEHEDD